MAVQRRSASQLTEAVAIAKVAMHSGAIASGRQGEGAGGGEGIVANLLASKGVLA